jgi:hypothetical protein
VATSGLALALARSDGASAQTPLPIPPLPAPLPPIAPALPTEPQQLVLRVGDTLRVEGAPMGCQVTRREGRPVIECRRDGALAGTYGTFMSDRSVTVARFRSRRTAQTILTATHNGGWRACTASARRSRTASTSRGCR